MYLLYLLISAASAASTYLDQDGDGYQANPLTDLYRDCDDADPGINPGAEELKENDLDDDCDGVVDEDDSAFDWSGFDLVAEVSECVGVLGKTSVAWRAKALELDACLVQEGAWRNCTCEDPDSNGDTKPERKWDARKRLFRDLEVVALAARVETFDARLTTAEGNATDALATAESARDTAETSRRILLGPEGTEAEPEVDSVLGRLNSTEAQAELLGDIVWGPTDASEPAADSLIGKVEDSRTRLTELESAGAELMVGLRGVFVPSYAGAEGSLVGFGPDAMIGYRWRDYMAGGMGFTGSYLLDVFDRAHSGFEFQPTVFLEPRFHAKDLDYVSVRPELGFNLFRWDGEDIGLYPLMGLRLGMNGGKGQKQKFQTWRVDVRATLTRLDEAWMCSTGFGFSIGGAPLLVSELPS